MQLGGLDCAIRPKREKKIETDAKLKVKYDQTKKAEKKSAKRGNNRSRFPAREKCNPSQTREELQHRPSAGNGNFYSEPRDSI